MIVENDISRLTERDNFFKYLFSGCTGMIEGRALPAKLQAFFEVADLAAVEAFCNRYQRNDLYFGVATRDGNGGTKGNIVHIPGVWVDVDFKETCKQTLGENLKRFPFKPSATVLSGGGVHLYWFLSEPATPDDIDQLENVNRRIAYTLGADLNSCDAARILRIPGTVNHKYPAPVKVHRLNEFRYELENFEDLPEPKKAWGNGLGRGEKTNSEGWLLEALRGVSEGNPGRNSTGAKIAGYYVNKLPKYDILTILSAWNENNKPPLKHQEVVRIVNSISKYQRSATKNGYEVKLHFERT